MGRWLIKSRRQMLPISSKSLNGSNSASRRAREVPKKKENHQNLTPEIISKSNPVHLSRFGRTRALIFTQNCRKIRFWAKKIFFFKIEKKNARTKTKVFLDSNGHNFFRTVEKTKKNQT